MNNRNGVLTFIAACIPGVGYMYNGLIKKGVQTLFLYMIIKPVLMFSGLGFLSHLVRICIWFYTFFDTYSIANRIRRGEYVPDSEFIFKNYVDTTKFTEGDFSYNKAINKQEWVIIGSSLVILGGLSILNQLFIDNDIYKFIRSYVTQYFIPALFVIIGVLIIAKKRK
ncbi:hypothetical protein ACJDU8_00800 [Clostridium sp. WILCCON 0269]|uniref:TM2 domain-containing protein n=1 Tax=Candidatus Clostridium eludens TaxID=3381663 RepID=A0ABW8SDM5_9CLOT